MYPGGHGRRRSSADGKYIGAVLATEGDRRVGIVTERHCARNVFLKGRRSPTTAVGDVMERKVIYVEPQQTAEACVALDRKEIRHLPVLRDGRVVGIVSNGDLLKSVIADREFNIEQPVLYQRG